MTIGLDDPRVRRGLVGDGEGGAVVLRHDCCMNCEGERGIVKLIKKRSTASRNSGCFGSDVMLVG